MENFVVSARKYRPSDFGTVIGQEHITQTLKNAIKNNHLAHAFLFCGPRGVGKTTCARILAKTINCQNITADTEACNECDSCKTFNANASFNIYELDAASNNSVDDIRGLVEQVRYAPQGAKYKIYIIDEVHMLSAAAFNAFLKTLEEPPPYAKFILATTERHKIFPTILSRCQVFDFHRIKAEHAVAQLTKICEKESITAEAEALHIIAQKADGAMRDALSIFDRIVSFSGKNITYKDVIQNLNILDYDYYFKATEYLLQKNLESLLLLFDDIINNGFDIPHFLTGFSEHFRNLSMCKFPNTVKLLEVAPSVQQRFLEQAKSCSMSLLLNGLNLINKCEQEMRSSKNQRLLVELYLMKLANIQALINLHSDEADSKKKTSELTATPLNTKPSPQPPVSNNQVTNEPATETQEPVQPTAPPPSRSIPLPGFKTAGHTSIQDKLSRLKQGITNNVKPEVVVEEALPEKEAYTENKLFTHAEFGLAFSAYVNDIETNGSRSLSVIYKNLQWRLIGDDKVVLTLGSKHEEEMVVSDRISIVPFLRKQLQNNNFDIEIEVNASVQPVKAFTAEDKFKLMCERNPNLIEFRNIFGLEIE